MENFWIATSIFCCKCHWKYALRGGIAPLLSYLSGKWGLDGCFLEFNYLYGENIRFAFRARQEYAEGLIRETDDHFNKLFCELNVSGDVQYGLYKPITIDNSGNVFRNKIQHILSSIILEVFQEDDIDDEMILTLAFYLNIALIRSSMDRGHISKEELRGFYMNLGHSGDENIDQDLMRGEFQENKEILLDIVNRINNHRDSEPLWLDKWMAACGKESEGEPMYPRENRHFTIHRKVIYSIYRQLGITERMGLMLSCFMHEIFISDL